MVDIAAVAGRASGRSQRPKARVDYTSQIYINVPTKAPVPPVSSKPKHRESNENISQGTGSEKKQKSTSPATIAARASKSASGSSKRSRGNALLDKSNAPTTGSPLGGKSKASQRKSGTIAEGKTRRNSGAEDEGDPASTPAREELPKRKKRKRTGDTAVASGSKENSLPGGAAAQPEEGQPNNDRELGAATMRVAGTSEPCADSERIVADPVMARPHVRTSEHLNLHTGKAQGPLAPEAAVVDLPPTADVRARISAEDMLEQRVMRDQGAQQEGGRSWNDIDAIFSRPPDKSALHPDISQTDIETLNKLVGASWQQRVDAAWQEVRVRTAEKEKQAAYICKLKAELQRQEERHSQHDDEVSKQLQRVKANYQKLYDRFQKLRGRNFEEAREVLEGIWESVEERSEMADQLIDAWKADAETHKSRLRDSELHAAKEELKTKQGEVLELKSKLLEEAEASLIQAQEIANLRHLVQSLEAVRPPTADASVQAQPSVSVGTTQTHRGERQFSLVSPVLSVQARRRAQALDVTCMARSLVPEGADVHSVDTNVMRAALLKPTEPSQASRPLVTGAVDAAAGPSSAAAGLIQPSPAACTPAGDVAAEGPMVPGVRLSSSVRPQPGQAVCTVEAIAPSNSERGSNAAAVAARLVATPQQRALILRDAEQPVRSDPGPVRQKIAHGGPHCMRVPAPHQELQGTPGLFASPGIPSNVAEVGDTGPPCLDNLQDGGPMSTSESDQRYGDASDDARAEHCDADAPLENDDDTSGGSGQGPAVEPGEATPEELGAGQVALGPVIAPLATGTPARTGARAHRSGDLDSGRSTDVQAQMRSFRDKMLSMEVIQSPYGSEYHCRDMKSGFTFTIKPCVSNAPGIRVPGDDDSPEVVDELTYVPHMETCPEHVKAKLLQVFQEEFDFRADHLHGLQKRIDRALEVVNGNL